MTDLRKAAQDVIDCVDSPYIPDEIRMVDVERIKALRQALQAEPENPDGAVLMDAITAAFQRGFAEASSNCQGFLDSSPPSVDALIAEIMDCEINGHYGDTGYDVGQVNAVIDKYRSAK